MGGGKNRWEGRELVCKRIEEGMEELLNMA